MRQIFVTMHDGAPDLCGGQRGEHRMAELVVPLPTERLAEIQSCIAIFSCDYELVLSQQILPGESGDLYFADGAAHIVLWQRLTLCRALRVQLECYNASGDFIARTKISEPILFRKSLADSLDEIAEVPEQAGVIAQLLAAMHTHGNKTVLDELGDLAGALTYRGESVRAAPLTNIEIEALLQQAMINGGNF